jgi:hypothetical protein
MKELGGAGQGYNGITIVITPGWWCNNHLEKYEFVNGKDDIPYMKWTINMFETTNQNNDTKSGNDNARC